MSEKLVDNDIVRGTLKKAAEGDEAVYPRKRTEYFMRFFWILGAAGIFFLNFYLLNSSTLTAHIVSFIQGVMALKIWNIINPYMDLAEEVGLVIPEDEIKGVDNGE